MAFVVRRPRGRWEIRESVATEAGPRARSLASFTALTPATLDRAERSARRSLDRDALVRAALRAGAPVAMSPAEADATSLVRGVARGQLLRPGLRRLVCDVIGGPAADDSLALWIGAPAEERGAALLDLLGLADRLPKPRRKPLDFPGLSRARLRG